MRANYLIPHQNSQMPLCYQLCLFARIFKSARLGKNPICLFFPSFGGIRAALLHAVTLAKLINWYLKVTGVIQRRHA